MIRLQFLNMFNKNYYAFNYFSNIRKGLNIYFFNYLYFKYKYYK